MKRITIFFALCAVCVCVAAKETLPQWAQELLKQNTGVIDSIKVVPLESQYLYDYFDDPEEAVQTRTYIIYYNQPVRHSNPTGAHFPLRATLTVFNDADITTAVNHVNCGGYALDSVWVSEPDAQFAYYSVNNSINEIAHRYHANYLYPEFRYFSFSAPERCYENLDDLRSEEAAEDFHNLFVALKKVMKGKWVMSGSSKGGTTTLLQHAFHPEDMDAYVPYAAPFFDTDCDTVMQKYWFNNGWTQEYLDLFMDIRRKALTRKDQIFPLYEKITKTYYPNESTDKLYGRYLISVGHLGFNEHAYQDTATLRKSKEYNEELFEDYGIEPYNDTVVAVIMINTKFRIESFGYWRDFLRTGKAPAPPLHKSSDRAGYLPFGVTAEQWWANNENGYTGQAYEYQARTELGYYDLRLDEISGPETGAAWNAQYRQYVGSLRDFDLEQYHSCIFNRSVYDRAVTTTQNAQKPIIFIYGADDTWTGAAMRDTYINGTNVRKFILPAQNHTVSFSANSDKAQCDAIRAMLDEVLLGTPQGIEEVSQQPSSVRVEKVLRNGQLLIRRGDTEYTVTGQRVR